MKKLFIAVSALALVACQQVETGTVGVWKYYGAVDPTPAEPGLNWYNPWSYDLVHINTSDQRYDGRTIAFTQDMQTATISYSLTFRLRPDRAIAIYSQWTDQWSDRLIPPAVPRVIKDYFGQVNATNAVSQRPVLQQRIHAALQARFQRMGIEIDTFDITNIDYSDAFEHAVEQAQVATQNAVAARNQTEVVREQATQRIARAEGDARAMQLEAAAMASNPQIVQMRAIEKWNGVLPVNMYGSAPLPFVGAR